MCVIIHTAKKRFLKRLDVIAAMKHNNSGFFMCHWPTDSRNRDDRVSVRTLVENEALDFFDHTPDDHMFVMHARIPSKGATSVDNVHGWEEDGVMFCHNMTMHTLDDIMEEDRWKGTDSEYFFRKLFMPMHRGEHLSDPSLKPGEMGPATKRLTALMCGKSNKFLFVMPDNSVIRAGDWSTLESERRTVMEEREVDEVIGETIDINGKIEKKTQKVKKEIAVEREFATAVASNLLFKSSYASAGTPSYPSAAADYWKQHGSCLGYGVESWGGCSRVPLQAKPAEKTIEEYDDLESMYGYGDDNDIPSKKASSRQKVKKGEITDAEIDRFKEWRKSLKDFQEPDVLSKSDIEGCLISNHISVLDDSDAMNPEVIMLISELILRCIVYNSYRENIDRIMDLDRSERFLGRKDEFGIFVSSSATLMDLIVPSEFSPTLRNFLVDELLEMVGNMSVEESALTCKYMLPSEAFSHMLLMALRQLDSDITSSSCDSGPSAYSISDPTSLAVGTDYVASLESVDARLNLSFDSTSKTNRDIEKYVRAGLVVGRKLKWIPPALLLADGRTSVTDTGSWITTATQKDYMTALNILSATSVLGGENLADADRKYVASLKSMGFTFDKKESEPAETKEAASTPAASADTPAEKPEKGDKTSVPASTGETPENAVLGDPESAEQGKEGSAT